MTTDETQTLILGYVKLSYILMWAISIAFTILTGFFIYFGFEAMQIINHIPDASHLVLGVVE
jgi:hypothetical protein